MLQNRHVLPVQRHVSMQAYSLSIYRHPSVPRTRKHPAQTTPRTPLPVPRLSQVAGLLSAAEDRAKLLAFQRA